MITTVEEFIRLRTSELPDEYQRAIHEPAPEAIWLELVASHPEMTFWVIQNKTVPLRVLEHLAHHPDVGIRSAVARKRKLSNALFEQLAGDVDERVRLAIASNQKTPISVLKKLAQDHTQLVAENALVRLQALATD